MQAKGAAAEGGKDRQNLIWAKSSLLYPVQEVQSNHFYDFLQPELAKHGYSSVYKKKTMEIYTGNSYAIDGCATFFKKDKFGLVKKYEVGIASLLACGHASCCEALWCLHRKCFVMCGGLFQIRQQGRPTSDICCSSQGSGLLP